MYNMIGWLGTILVLTAYFFSKYMGRRLFDWANVVLCVPVALPAIVRGAWSNVFISLAFGLIGLWNVLQPE